MDWINATTAMVAAVDAYIRVRGQVVGGSEVYTYIACVGVWREMYCVCWWEEGEVLCVLVGGGGGIVCVGGGRGRYCVCW